MRVVMLVATDLTYDARVQRSARSLPARGYDVTVAGASIDLERAQLPADAGYRIEITRVERPREAAQSAQKERRLGSAADRARSSSTAAS